MDDSTHLLITTEQGAQALVSCSPLLAISVQVDGDPVASEQPMQLTETEADDLTEKMQTQTVEFDTITAEITLMPKTPDTPTSTNQGHA